MVAYKRFQSFIEEFMLYHFYRIWAGRRVCKTRQYETFLMYISVWPISYWKLYVFRWIFICSLTKRLFSCLGPVNSISLQVCWDLDPFLNVTFFDLIHTMKTKKKLIWIKLYKVNAHWYWQVFALCCSMSFRTAYNDLTSSIGHIFGCIIA